MMPKKIVLVSPFPPAQNPRLYKEYLALKQVGYQVDVFYAERDSWSQGHLLNKDFHLVAGRNRTLLHLFSRIVHKVAKRLLPYEFAYHRASIFLWWKVIHTKADLYIGHDLTSLSVVVRAAKKNNSKCGFDAEDFHRNEVTDDTKNFFFKSSKQIEDRYLKKLDYLSCASPLITKAYHELYVNLRPITINNVFPKTYISQNNCLNAENKTLKLFWFSQTIGKGRGLEAVIEAIGESKSSSIQLTLLGDSNFEEKNYFLNLAVSKGLNSKQLKFVAPVAPQIVFKIASSHDVGLALEIHEPYNRDICLTNKIFTYLTSGLAIIASDTKAQKRFFTENNDVGFLFSNKNINELKEILLSYLNNPEILKSHRNNASMKASNKYNWEVESQFFLETISSTLNE